MNKNIFFETIKCDDYEVFNLTFHEDRVAKTIAKNLNLQDYIYPPSNELSRCKVVYDESSILSVDFFPYKKREINTFRIIEVAELEYSKKYFDRTELELLFNKRESCDEIIIIKNGLVTDTSIANIAIFDGDNWITPKKPLLAGTTRARLLKNAELIEKDITLEMLLNSKKLALMNAMIDFDEIQNYSFSYK
ncbi:aminotransferase class IV family protein [Halarcobacter bivalviorum]|uniref:Branched-chain amino acid aminotransferase n=1 Tax=Halarcobacter bivalviorum TaxID=663364 RepID=A0AAX2A5R5_9BACT|nr:aminotransferase class IV family protein [Halarcobacter bivalviorum]AXH11300.1 branched-chain amino acid aminotransferase, possible 4-amino-4-deoxychorismate lyase PabC [Halarcobacter bivalviorum]RXK09567.1 branched-chain amino acid aminotransferase [Halarcobacter bivalviorum]